MPEEIKDFYTNVKDLINDTRIGRPHVVVLGAGASLQAFLKGDRNGKALPLMNNFVEMLNLDSLFREHKINYTGKNFEDIYNDLYENGDYRDLIKLINRIIQDYFRSLELPPYPTLYDHLVLSLRDKDLIATFNWDPFLYYACWRNHKKTKLPHVVYLHGNVAIGYCQNDNARGWINHYCNKCGNSFTPSRLLYPIKKNYSQEPFIRDEWKTIKDFLKHAYILTIFGYSAPKSDIEAIRLMQSAWRINDTWDINQIEIIDTKNKKEIKDTWVDFIHTHHYDVTNDFYKSSIGLFPRRTCEAEWNYSMTEKLAFYPQNPIPRNLDFPKLWDWYKPLIQAENIIA